MRAERARRYADLMSDTTVVGEDRENAIYDLFQDLTEANLLRSLSTDVTLDTCYFLYEKALDHLGAGVRVLELASWTGGFSSFIAEQHPQCMVTGVDRASKMIDLSNALYRSENLSFFCWDYRYPKTRFSATCRCVALQPRYKLRLPARRLCGIRRQFCTLYGRLCVREERSAAVLWEMAAGSQAACPAVRGVAHHDLSTLPSVS